MPSSVLTVEVDVVAEILVAAAGHQPSPAELALWLKLSIAAPDLWSESVDRLSDDARAAVESFSVPESRRLNEQALTLAESSQMANDRATRMAAASRQFGAGGKVAAQRWNGSRPPGGSAA